MTKLHRFEVGDLYDAFEHSFEDNIRVLGRPLARHIEVAKSQPRQQMKMIVSEVDTVNCIVTIRPARPGER